MKSTGTVKRWETKFLRSRIWPLTIIVVLFLLWGIVVSILLAQAKIGEKLELVGSFSFCESCGSNQDKPLRYYCFSGEHVTGNVAAAKGEEFLLRIESVAGKDSNASIKVVVEEWLLGAVSVSICFGTEEPDAISVLAGGEPSPFMFTVRRKSLLKVLSLAD